MMLLLYGRGVSIEMFIATVIVLVTMTIVVVVIVVVILSTDDGLGRRRGGGFEIHRQRRSALHAHGSLSRASLRNKRRLLLRETEQRLRLHHEILTIHTDAFTVPRVMESADF